MTSNKKLFGTDGVRGKSTVESGKGRINPETFFGLGVASVDILNPTRVVVGRDTRQSGARLSTAVIEGALRAGAHVIDLGIVPTPLVGWATDQIENSIGIIVTASHNPVEDNGFKILKKRGKKTTTTEQGQIETAYYEQPPDIAQLAQVIEYAHDAEMRDQYIFAITNKLEEMFGDSPLEGKVIIVDTAYGAAQNVTQVVLHRLGAKIHSADRAYNGKINDGYGANNLNGVKRYIRKYREAITTSPHFLGALANDGDGDRVMGIAVVDGQPHIIDGNHIMYYLAQGQDGIVGTDYTNSGLVSRLHSEGIEFAYCPNGDAHVTEALQRKTAEGHTWKRGGEFTGHLIDTDHLLSGDGVYMATWFACSVASKGQTFADVYKELPLWHEVMDNIQLEPQHISVISDPRLMEFIEHTKEQLGADGRLHIRPSGTEPLLRVWGESPDEQRIQETIASIGKYARMLVEVY